MITIEYLKELALAFDETTEQPHFERPSFRVKKKIFVTLDLKNNRACLKLSAIDQSVFSAMAKTIIYPVPNKWGQQGWTYVELGKVDPELFKDALTSAYCDVAPKQLGDRYKNEN